MKTKLKEDFKMNNQENKNVEEVVDKQPIGNVEVTETLPQKIWKGVKGFVEKTWKPLLAFGGGVLVGTLLSGTEEVVECDNSEDVVEYDENSENE